MSTGILFLYENLLDSATLTASSAATGFPANNLKNPFRSKVWRTGGTTGAYATLVIDNGSSKEMDSIALIGYNWSTAPGTLRIEFNDTDSWATPAAIEDLTWAANPTANYNNGIIVKKFASSHTYRYARLKVEQGVTLTADAANPSISVADDDDIDFGIGDFTLVWKGALPAWPPNFASASPFIGKYSTYGFQFKILTAGTLQLTLLRNDGGVAFISTVATTFIDGTTHDLVVVCTREVASTAGSIDFYVDGYKLGASVAITAASPVTLSNTGALYVCGTGGGRYASTSHFVALYNRALTAAEVLDLYRNGINFADQWGSQSALNSSFTETTVAPYTTFDGASATGFHAISDGTGTHIAGTADEIVFELGKSYQVDFTLTLTSGTAPFYKPAASHGGAALTGSAKQDAVAGNNSYRFIAGVATTGVIDFYNTSTATEYTITNLTVRKIGATLALEPSGIGASDWQDSSSNNLDASYPATGYTLPSNWDLGRIFLGAKFQPTLSFRRAHSVNMADPSYNSKTIGGQDHVDEIEQYREIDFSLPVTTQAQWELYQKMINHVGVRKDLVIAFDYDNEPDEMTIYGKFTKLPGMKRDSLIELPFSFKESR